MTLQNFFYATASSAIIVITILIIVLIIISIVIVYRIAKFSRHLSIASKKLEEIVKKIKEKVKYHGLISVITRGLKETVLFIKEKRQPKKKKK